MSHQIRRIQHSLQTPLVINECWEVILIWSTNTGALTLLLQGALTIRSQQGPGLHQFLYGKSSLYKFYPHREQVLSSRLMTPQQHNPLQRKETWINR